MPEGCQISRENLDNGGGGQYDASGKGTLKQTYPKCREESRMDRQVKRIGVLTSGGDAPGMNAGGPRRGAHRHVPGHRVRAASAGAGTA